MRTTAQLSALFSLLLLVSGCQSYTTSRFWKAEQKLNYMNDAHFSVPSQQLSPSPSAL